MGPLQVTIRLENALGKTAQVVETQAVIDPKLTHLQIPAGLVSKLGLQSFGMRVEELPDGLGVRCRYVGPVRLQLGESHAFAGAVEIGDQVVLGNIPLSALALRLDSSDETLRPVSIRV